MELFFSVVGAMALHAPLSQSVSRAHAVHPARTTTPQLQLNRGQRYQAQAMQYGGAPAGGMPYGGVPAGMMPMPIPAPARLYGANARAQARDYPMGYGAAGMPVGRMQGVYAAGSVAPMRRSPVPMEAPVPAPRLYGADARAQARGDAPLGGWVQTPRAGASAGANGNTVQARSPYTGSRQPAQPAQPQPAAQVMPVPAPQRDLYGADARAQARGEPPLGGGLPMTGMSLNDAGAIAIARAQMLIEARRQRAAKQGAVPARAGLGAQPEAAARQAAARQAAAQAAAQVAPPPPRRPTWTPAEGYGEETPMPGREKDYEEALKVQAAVDANGPPRSEGPDIDDERRSRSPGLQKNFYDLPTDDFRRPHGMPRGVPLPEIPSPDEMAPPNANAQSPFDLAPPPAAFGMPPPDGYGGMPPAGFAEPPPRKLDFQSVPGYGEESPMPGREKQNKEAFKAELESSFNASMVPETVPADIESLMNASMAEDFQSRVVSTADFKSMEAPMRVAEPSSAAKTSTPPPGTSNAAATESELQAAAPKAEAKVAAPKPEAKVAAPKAEAKVAAPKPEAKVAAPKPEAKPEAKVTEKAPASPALTMNAEVVAEASAAMEAMNKILSECAVRTEARNKCEATAQSEGDAVWSKKDEQGLQEV